MIEIWKHIPDYEGYYQVSNFGNVRSIDRIAYKKSGQECRIMGRLLKPALLKIGYLAVNLHKNDGGKTTYVHALVANTFLGIQALSMDVCHNDGIKTNNRVDNLRYDSRRNNLKDCDKHGTRVRGGKASWSKVTEQDVIIIRRLRKETGLTNKQIGEIFGLKAPSISLICSRKNWAHVL